MRRDTFTPTPRAAKLGPLALLGTVLLLVVASCAAIFIVPFAIRQRQFDGDLLWLDRLLAVAWRLVPLAAVVMALRIAWRRLGWSSTISAEHQIEYARAIAPALAAQQKVSAPAQIIDQTPEPPALPPPGPSLPDVALLGDVLPSLPRGKIAYGVLGDGSQLTLTFGAAYHILYGGDTRSGKSNALDSLLVQLHHQRYVHGYQLRVLLGDFKRELLATWSRSPLVETIETEPKAIADLLFALTRGADGILDRYKRFEWEGRARNRVIRNLGEYTQATGQHLPLTFAVIDELNALLTIADRDDKLANALRVVLQMGAGAGVYVASGAQYLSAGVFSRDGSKQFVSRAMFGAPDPILTKMMFGSSKLEPTTIDLIDGRPGRGLIRTAGQARPQAFQCLRCDEADILDAVDLADRPARGSDRDRDGRASEVRGSGNGALLDTLLAEHFSAENSDERKSTSATSHALPATSGTSAGLDPERFYGVKYLSSKGRSKSEIIRELWGVTGGRRYAEAAAEYDQIRAALEGGTV